MRRMRIMIEDRQDKVKCPTGLRLLIRKTCVATLQYERFKGDFEISCSFVDDAEIQLLNKQYRGKDLPTDVLSFPLSDKPGEFEINRDTGAKQLGDIVISLERAKMQAEAYNHSFQREVAYLVMHSVLHLLGYDHEKSKTESLAVREKEDAIIEALGVHGPYDPDFE